MAIFEAELQRKTAPEDQLTSRVFGALSIMDKRNVQIPFLRKLIEASRDGQLQHLASRLTVNYSTWPAVLVNYLPLSKASRKSPCGNILATDAQTSISTCPNIAL